jgi:hypothetical protein
MIKSCDYCFAVFDQDIWDFCTLKNDEDETETTLCSQCLAEIILNRDGDVFYYLVGNLPLN